jgi:hypothetical protein
LSSVSEIHIAVEFTPGPVGSGAIGLNVKLFELDGTGPVTPPVVIVATPGSGTALPPRFKVAGVKVVAITARS